MNLCIIGLLAMASLMCGSVQGADEWFVSVTGEDAEERGKSEETAFRTINYAISRAAANDTITLLPGDHKEGPETVNGLASVVNVTKPLVIRSKGREFRDTTRIIGSKDPNASATAGIGDNAIRCVRIDAAAAGARLEGITLYGGSTAYNGNSGVEKSEGGGVYVAANTLAYIVDCAFIDCQSTRGGGIYSDSGSGPVAVRCLFKRCLDTKFGSGMRGGSAYYCVFDDCAQARDSAGNKVGETNSNPLDAFTYGYSAINCTFLNSPGYGIKAHKNCFKGGVYNCLFQYNGGNGIATESGYSLSEKTANNIQGESIDVRPEVISPFDNDYSLNKEALAVNAGSAKYLEEIPEEFRYCDYNGNIVSTEKVHAGAVQECSSATICGVKFHVGSFSKWNFAGKEVDVARSTWRANRLYYVDQDEGLADNDGFTEKTALPSISAAMARAVEGDKVIALPGTYETDKVVPTLAEAGSEIAPTIPSRVVVKKGVTLESRDGAATTIIKGAPASGSDWPVRCVYLCANAVLRGFTITGGNTASYLIADPSSDTMSIDNYGGGIAAYPTTDASLLPLVEDCIIKNNKAIRGGGVQYGLYRRCIFEGNSVYSTRPGTAIFWAKAEGCLFKDNGNGKHSTVYGCELLNCTFIGSQARNSGIIINEGVYKTTKVANCIIDAGLFNVGYMTNCAVKAGAENKYANPKGGNNIEFDGMLDSNGKLLAGCTAIDCGVASHCTQEYLSGRDLAGVRRVVNGKIDIGAFEYNYGAVWGNILGDKNLVMTDMPPNAVLSGNALVFDSGEVKMTWGSGGKDATYKFVARVTGNGKLKVIVNGEEVGDIDVADEEERFSFKSSLSENELSFVYTQGEDDQGRAELYFFEHKVGLVLSLR